MIWLLILLALLRSRPQRFQVGDWVKLNSKGRKAYAAQPPYYQTRRWYVFQVGDWEGYQYVYVKNKPDSIGWAGAFPSYWLMRA